MCRKTLAIDVSEAHELLVRRYVAFLEEMDQVADAAPEGAVLDRCEEAVLRGGRDLQQRVLTQAVQRRLAAAEKKGRRSAAVRAAAPKRTAGPAPGTS